MLVLDASVALAWIFPDEQDPMADSVLERIGDGAAVPSVWILEVLNALLVGERRGRITQADVATSVALLGDLPIEPRTSSLIGEGVHTLELARAHNLSTYDAAYLELATRLGLPLATLDGRLRAAAEAIGIDLIGV